MRALRIYIHTCIHSTHTHTNIRTYIRTHLHTPAHMSTNTYVYIHIYVYIQTCIQRSMHVQIHAYNTRVRHMYTHRKYMHVYTHAHTCVHWSMYARTYTKYHYAGTDTRFLTHIRSAPETSSAAGAFLETAMDNIQSVEALPEALSERMKEVLIDQLGCVCASLPGHICSCVPLQVFTNRGRRHGSEGRIPMM
jgi:hypothetical protein